MKKEQLFFNFLVASLVLVQSGCGGGEQKPSSASSSDLEQNNSSQYTYAIDPNYYTFRNNKSAYIPPQCYTKVKDKDKEFNPCYSCHTQSKEPNFVNDEELQLNYLFTRYATQNRWSNLFKDKSAKIETISDTAILKYVQKSNYFDENGSIILASRLKKIPAKWDVYNDGKWNGYIPDCYYNFDEEGFDRKPDGNYTLWRSFAYYPFLGTFWPTNGSTDDVLIRLPHYFAEDVNGTFDIEVYKTNLAIIEAFIKDEEVAFAFDEARFGIDADKDGSITHANTIARFNEDNDIFYVGKAGSMLASGKIEAAKGLYPVGTEFLHSVRYIDFNETTKKLQMSARMKELRYAKKERWVDVELHKIKADIEATERTAYPNAIKQFDGNSESGLNNKLCCTYIAFIEDNKGELRPQNYEELVFCMGCHGTIGSTIDTIFSFSRKFKSDTLAEGWYHWSQHGFENIPERIRDDGEYEYSYYLLHNKAGDEFRENREVIEKFFNESFEPKEEAFEKLHNDISYLLIPSKERALMLDKAYLTIVQEQSFIFGRDANDKPVTNVLKEVEQFAPTGITTPLHY